MNILGISCFYHDSAACLLKDGKVVAAAQEERFSRKKHDDSFPRGAVEYCLKEAGVDINEIDYVVFYEKPLLKFERILEGYLDTFPLSYWAFFRAMSVWLRHKLWIPEIIKKELRYKGKIYFVPHHLSHAASAYLVSPYNEAAIITVDAVGEWSTTTIAHGKGSNIEILKEITWPHSLGMLYSAFTYYLGFKVNSAEYKVMGASPYGQPKYMDVIKKYLINIKDDGSFELNMKYFKYHYGLRMINSRFIKLFGHPPREPEAKIEQFHWDMAASIQEVTNEIMVKLARFAHQITGSKNICLAGGVALNCVSNEKILDETAFENIFVQPAAGDAGGAMGAAVFIDNHALDNGRRTRLEHSYLGPQYNDEVIKNLLEKLDLKYCKLGQDELLDHAAKSICEQKVLGWFQGRMEWGPRALGNRSIVADPRNKENWQRVNLKIKFRESFRPFAPSVISEKATDYFILNPKAADADSPAAYMILTAPVAEGRGSEIPAVTHVNNSARLQTVFKEKNFLYHSLIQRFYELTGCPVVINTSFNVRGEPIVCTPRDALACFINTEMDTLYLNNYVIEKSGISEEYLADLRIKFSETFDLD